LARMGPLAGGATAKLARALSADKPRRLEIVEALGRLGPPAREALPALLERTEQAARARRLQAMTRMGVPTKEIKELVIRALDDREASVRNAALAHLAAHGLDDVPVSAVEGLLQREPLAARVLLLEGRPDPVVKALAARKEVDEEYLKLAAWAGSAARPLREAIRAALDGPRKARAAQALLRIDPKDDGAAKALLAAVAAKDRLAFEAAMEHPGRAAQFVPVLARLLDAKEGLPTRLQAARALGAFGKGAAEAAPALMGLLADLERSHEETLLFVEDRVAMRQIGNFRLHEPGVVVDEESFSRLAPRLDALASFSPEAVADAKAGLEELRADLASRVVRAMRAVGPASSDAAAKMLAGTGIHPRRAAALFLMEGDGGKEELAEAMRSHDAILRARAATALARRKDRSALPVLLRGLADEDDAAVQSLEGLAALGTQARPLLPAVAKAARRLNPVVRRAVYRTAAALDAPAWLLRRGTVDRDPRVRAEAALRLARAEKGFDPTPHLIEAMDEPAMLDALGAGTMPRLARLAPKGPAHALAVARMRRRVFKDEAGAADIIAGVLRLTFLRDGLREQALKDLEALGEGAKRARLASKEIR
ncbi:MAG: hypothetical protein K2W96_02935, partial [Gemmataceae bacterium]|nr:hypothetical protein [Gemmataceae bacterium]